MDDWIVPAWPAPAGVRALITTRLGGVSERAYASLNLADHVGDDANRVRENRRRLALRVPAEPVWLMQEHGIRVVRADDASIGTRGDAAVAFRPGRACAVLTADCLPVLLCDRRARSVAAVHAGWRGLAAGVIEAAVAAMDADAESVLAYLGPAIGPASFEVGADVRTAFLARDPAAAAAFEPLASGKFMADLYRLARRRLAACGITEVWGGDYDTFAESHRFFSYRRDRTTGRMAAVTWLEP
jgi:hypothetical protein